MKNKINTIIIIIGVCLILYPIIAKIIMNFHETYVIKEYQKDVKTYDASEIKDIMEKADKYNKDLVDNTKVKKDKNTDTNINTNNTNNSHIDLSNNGQLLGYINIPKITVYLPIYYGTSDDVLDSGVGLLKDSSIPIGGENTHAVITGHSGLIKAKMFDDISKLEIGDKFYIHIMNKKLEYEVDNIQTVTPDYLDASQIIEGRDLVTLVTCTPYLINTHRLLVRGTRVNNTEEQENVNLGESQEEIENLQSINIINIVLIVISILIVATVIAICIIIKKRKKNPKENKIDTNQNKIEGNDGK